MSLESKIDQLNINLENLTNAVIALVYAQQNRVAPASVLAVAPVEVAPVEVAPVEAAPVEAAPVEAAPVEAAPVEAAPETQSAPVIATADSLKALCLEKSRADASLRAPIKTVLAEFGASKISDLSEQDIGPCFDKVMAL